MGGGVLAKKSHYAAMLFDLKGRKQDRDQAFANLREAYLLPAIMGGT